MGSKVEGGRSGWETGERSNVYSGGGGLGGIIMIGSRRMRLEDELSDVSIRECKCWDIRRTVVYGDAFRASRSRDPIDEGSPCGSVCVLMGEYRNRWHAGHEKVK